MLNKQLLSFIVITYSLLFHSVSMATPRDILARTIPASACQLADHDQGELVKLDLHGWVFKEGKTGNVKLFCPFPVNANTISNQSNANYISGFTIFYMDPDAKGLDAQITARILDVSIGVINFTSIWDSNTVASKKWHEEAHYLSKTLQSNAMLTFEINMSRTSDELPTLFTGIRFERYVK